MSTYGAAFAGSVTHALEGAVALLPSLIAGECWAQSPSGVWDDLIGFYSSTPLVASHSGSSSTTTGGSATTEEKRTTIVDLPLAAKFASSHTLSLRLAARCAASGSAEWCYDMSGDDLLQRLTFQVQSAIAVPVLVQSSSFSSTTSTSSSSGGKPAGKHGNAAPNHVFAVMIFYSSQHEEKNESVLSALQGLSQLVSSASALSTAVPSAGEPAHQRISFRSHPSDTTESSSSSSSSDDPATGEAWQTGAVGLMKAAAAALKANFVEICVRSEIEASNAGIAPSGVHDAPNPFMLREPRLLVSLYPHVVSTRSLSSSSSSSPSQPGKSTATATTTNTTTTTTSSSGSGPPVDTSIGLSASSPFTEYLAETSLVTRTLCSAAAAGGVQQVVWLMSHDMALRKISTWQTAAVLSMSLPVGSSFPLSASNNNGGKHMRPIHIVALLYWTEADECCGGVEATSFLSSIAATARSFVALSPPASEHWANNSNNPSAAGASGSSSSSNGRGSSLKPAARGALAREESSENNNQHSSAPPMTSGGRVPPHSPAGSTASGGGEGAVLSLIHFAASGARLNEMTNATTTAAATTSSSSNENSNLLGSRVGGMRKPRSGLDLLAALGATDDALGEKDGKSQGGRTRSDTVELAADETLNRNVSTLTANNTAANGHTSVLIGLPPLPPVQRVTQGETSGTSTSAAGAVDPHLAHFGAAVNPSPATAAGAGLMMAATSSGSTTFDDAHVGEGDDATKRARLNNGDGAVTSSSADHNGAVNNEADQHQQQLQLLQQQQFLMLNSQHPSMPNMMMNGRVYDPQTGLPYGNALNAFASVQQGNNNSGTNNDEQQQQLHHHLALQQQLQQLQQQSESAASGMMPNMQNFNGQYMQYPQMQMMQQYGNYDPNQQLQPMMMYGPNGEPIMVPPSHHQYHDANAMMQQQPPSLVQMLGGGNNQQQQQSATSPNPRRGAGARAAVGIHGKANNNNNAGARKRRGSHGTTGDDESNEELLEEVHGDDNDGLLLVDNTGMMGGTDGNGGYGGEGEEMGDDGQIHHNHHHGHHQGHHHLHDDDGGNIGDEDDGAGVMNGGEEEGEESGDAPSSSAPKKKRRGGKRAGASYSLHPSEHLHMTAAGLPAVSAAALARVKGRSRAPKPKLSVALRRGKWPAEEEDFTSAIVDTFRAGLLPLADGTTLRTYLSGQLHCAPMRITKKFAKDASIGKQVYKRRMDLDEGEWRRRSADAKASVIHARAKFHKAVWDRTCVDLSQIAPDPFPANGIVRDAFGSVGDNDGDGDDDEDDDSALPIIGAGGGGGGGGEQVGNDANDGEESAPKVARGKRTRSGSRKSTGNAGSAAAIASSSSASGSGGVAAATSVSRRTVLDLDDGEVVDSGVVTPDENEMLNEEQQHHHQAAVGIDYQQTGAPDMGEHEEEEEEEEEPKVRATASGTRGGASKRGGSSGKRGGARTSKNASYTAKVAGEEASTLLAVGSIDQQQQHGTYNPMMMMHGGAGGLYSSAENLMMMTGTNMAMPHNPHNLHSIHRMQQQQQFSQGEGGHHQHHAAYPDMYGGVGQQQQHFENSSTSHNPENYVNGYSNNNGSGAEMGSMHASASSSASLRSLVLPSTDLRSHDGSNNSTITNAHGTSGAKIDTGSSASFSRLGSESNLLLEGASTSGGNITPMGAVSSSSHASSSSKGKGLRRSGDSASVAGSLNSIVTTIVDGSAVAGGGTPVAAISNKKNK